MKYILIIGTALVLITFIYKLASYLLFKYRIRKGYYTFFKLKGFKPFTWIHFIAGIVSSLVGFGFYKLHHYDGILVFWNVLAITQIIHCFITPDFYLVLSSKGIKNYYNSNLIAWDSIKKVTIINTNKDELALSYGKKPNIIRIGDRQFLDKIIRSIQEYRTDVYNRLFKDL